MKPKWTPGKWRWNRDYPIKIINESDDTICSGLWPSQTADANLICSAPDLYAALEELVKALEPLEAVGQLPFPGIATLNLHRAALKRARGEE